MILICLIAFLAASPVSMASRLKDGSGDGADPWSPPSFYYMDGGNEVHYILQNGSADINAAIATSGSGFVNTVSSDNDYWNGIPGRVPYEAPIAPIRFDITSLEQADLTPGVHTFKGKFDTLFQLGDTYNTTTDEYGRTIPTGTSLTSVDSNFPGRGAGTGFRQFRADKGEFTITAPTAGSASGYFYLYTNEGGNKVPDTGTALDSITVPNGRVLKGVFTGTSAAGSDVHLNGTVASYTLLRTGLLLMDGAYGTAPLYDTASTVEGQALTLVAQDQRGGSVFAAKTMLWDFGDGTTLLSNGDVYSGVPNSRYVTHTYTAPGTYKVSVTAVDSNGFVGDVGYDFAYFQIDNVPLTDVTLSADTTTADIGQAVHFTGTQNDPGSDVTVAWNFGDGNTAAGTLTPAHSYAAGGDYTVTLTVSETGSATISKTVGIHVNTPAPADTTAPTTTASADPLPNAAGWNNGPVTVSLSATDPDDAASAITTTYSLDGTNYLAYPAGGIVLSGDGQYTVRYKSIDAAQNAESAKSISIKIDSVAPVITPTVPAANANGWYNANVVVPYTVVDVGGSGVAVPSGSISFTSEGAGQHQTITATDLAGNVGSATVSGINVDMTAPVITPAKPAANDYGWYKADVVVPYTVTDALSGPTAPTGSITFSSEGSGLSKDITASDLAGNVATVTVSGISLDKTAPTISGSALPAPNANGWNNGPVTVSFSANDGLSGLITVTPAKTLSTDGAGQSVIGTATDKAGNSASSTVGNINIDQAAPVLGTINAPSDPVKLGTTITVSDTFTDTSGLASATWTWDDGSSTAATALTSPLTVTHKYAATGIYTVTLATTDKAGNSATTKFDYVVVYDPTGGCTTGVGWINSPAGAYASNPTLKGKAVFGFVSKYAKNSYVPKGDTEFLLGLSNGRSHDGMWFTSTTNDWLVVSGSKAIYEGSGKIYRDGSWHSGYDYLVSASDAQYNGGRGTDAFRIKIWDRSTGAVVYDNMMGAADDAVPTTTIAGGAIVVTK